ncbi:hypothetical protein [Streptomyces sp. NRRL S-337]|uniref:hypothetical protein n=1 Tax=Streptomyces sp. NRRL S-337 TaxID=1463900 RepID=UPI00068FDCCD|nr:hypothetical protein [Streptomyces sp. NRRL S-337]
MQLSGQRRSLAWCGRLLLLAGLLFGIVAMHSLGHLAEHRASPPPHATVMAAAAAPAHHHAARPADDGQRADRPDHGVDHSSPAGGTDHSPPPGGTDPMSVCLAVLGTGFLVLLLGGAFVHRPTDVPAAATTRLPHSLQPIPPPRRGTLLAQLSVLRV